MLSIPSPPRDLDSAQSLNSLNRWPYYGGIALVLLIILASRSAVRTAVLYSVYLPHAYCYLGSQGLIWSHVVTDSLIGLSYLTISITLGHLVLRSQAEIPFHWMFLAFGFFIIACGMTHFMEVLTVWIPVYVLAAYVKGFTAVASLTTAIALPFIVPRILLMVHRAGESERYLRFLESALSERDAAQQQLREANEFLEVRVRERTSELARANESLQASETHYRVLFDSNPMPMWVFDCESLRFLAVNEAAVRHYGYSQQEFLSMTIEQIRPEEDVPRLRESVSNRVLGLSDPELWRHRTKNGVIILTEITSYPIQMQGRDAELILAHDVTRQLESQEDLRQSEEKFEKAFRSSPLAITISSEKEGRYLDVNEAFLKLTGHERETIIGTTSAELRIWANPTDRQRMLQELNRTGRADNLQSVFRTKSGDLRMVQISAERITLDGETCVLANTLDVTESRNLEEQFRHAQKMEAVGRLAGGVAHDFNNLLSVIIGYSELAQEGSPSDQVGKHLDQIKQAGHRAASLTRQLLAFSRKQVLQPRVLDLNTVVRSVSKMLLRLIGEDVSLILKPTEPLDGVRADLGQIEQILMNLVVNARDAMPDGGKVIIETANVVLDDTYIRQHPDVKIGSYVMISVSDTGCGMDKKILSRIFEPFFTTKTQGKGTGLGLSTVYGIVQQSGGHIWVYSEPMRGSTFKIYFPRTHDAVEPLSCSGSASVVERGTEAILLVEDDGPLRSLVAELLRSAGYSVLETGDAPSAIAIAGGSQKSIDLVLTDVIMPGMSGGELAAHLRMVRPKLPILFMSGYASDLLVHAGIAEPEGFVLQKPFARKDLLTKVRSILDKSGE